MITTNSASAVEADEPERDVVGDAVARFNISAEQRFTKIAKLLTKRKGIEFVAEPGNANDSYGISKAEDSLVLREAYAAGGEKALIGALTHNLIANKCNLYNVCSSTIFTRGVDFGNTQKNSKIVNIIRDSDTSIYGRVTNDEVASMAGLGDSRSNATAASEVSVYRDISQGRLVENMNGTQTFSAMFETSRVVKTTIDVGDLPPWIMNLIEDTVEFNSKSFKLDPNTRVGSVVVPITFRMQSDLVDKTLNEEYTTETEVNLPLSAIVLKEPGKNGITLYLGTCFNKDGMPNAFSNGGANMPTAIVDIDLKGRGETFFKPSSRVSTNAHVDNDSSVIDFLSDVCNGLVDDEDDNIFNRIANDVETGDLRDGLGTLLAGNGTQRPFLSIHIPHKDIVADDELCLAMLGIEEISQELNDSPIHHRFVRVSDVTPLVKHVFKGGTSKKGPIQLKSGANASLVESCKGLIVESLGGRFGNSSKVASTLSLLEEYRKYEYFGKVAESTRAYRKMYQKYGGSRAYIEHQSLERFKNALTRQGQEDGDNAFPYELLMLRGANGRKYLSEFEGVDDMYEETWGDVDAELMEIFSASSSKAANEKINDLFEKIRERLPPPPSDSNPDSGYGDDQMPQGPSGDPGDGEAEDCGSPPPSQAQQDVQSKMQQVSKDIEDGGKEEVADMSGLEGGFDEAQFDHETKQSLQEEQPLYSNFEYELADNMIDTLRSISIEVARKTRVSVRKFGRVDGRRLAGIVSGDAFLYRNEPGQELDMAATVLIDCSGSMHGYKRVPSSMAGAPYVRTYSNEHSAKDVEVAGAVARSFTNALWSCGVETATWLFPWRVQGGDIRADADHGRNILEAMDDGSMSDLIDAYDRSKAPGVGWNNESSSAMSEIPATIASLANGGTPTLQAAINSAMWLSTRKKSQRIMFILTDGQPNDAHSKAWVQLREFCDEQSIQVVSIFLKDARGSNGAKGTWGTRAGGLAPKSNYQDFLDSDIVSDFASLSTVVHSELEDFAQELQLTMQT